MDVFEVKITIDVSAVKAATAIIANPEKHLLWQPVGHLVREKARRYPKKLPNQKYVRTFKLKNSWEAVKGRGKVWFTVQSLRPNYNKWVQSDEYQARIHRNRWWPLSEIAKRATPDVIKQVDKQLQKALDNVK